MSIYKMDVSTFSMDNYKFELTFLYIGATQLQNTFNLATKCSISHTVSLHVYAKIVKNRYVLQILHEIESIF